MPRSQVVLNRELDVLERLGFRFSLRPAIRQPRTRNRIAFFGMLKHDAISHGQRILRLSREENEPASRYFRGLPFLENFRLPPGRVASRREALALPALAIAAFLGGLPATVPPFFVESGGGSTNANCSF